MTTKLERQEYVLRRANELAASGRYIGYQDIEHELVLSEGYHEARGWLDNRGIRDRLDAACAAARRGADDA